MSNKFVITLDCLSLPVDGADWLEVLVCVNRISYVVPVDLGTGQVTGKLLWIGPLRVSRQTCCDL